MPSDPTQTSHAVHHCDVLLIGGGPAGSTAATLLAEKGYRVTSAGKGTPPPLPHRRIPAAGQPAAVREAGHTR